MSYTIHPPKDKASDKMKFHRSKHLWPEQQNLIKPQWLRKKVGSSERIDQLVSLFQSQELVTVCQEASCPNLVECFDHKIATFMIMGALCTRRCSFCDVGHGRPLPLDPQEPERLAKTVLALGLRYVVITSVDRDDLVDGGAQHFVDCIKAVRQYNPDIIVECLVPDFRGRQSLALEIFAQAQPDVFNHNIETVPSLYFAVRPGSDYHVSLHLLKSFKQMYPHIPTKSGIMLGLGETESELQNTLRDLREYLVDGVTIGQYLPPSSQHYPLIRYITPEEFQSWEAYAKQLGFSNVASGTFVRSSYQADVFSKDLLL